MSRLTHSKMSNTRSVSPIGQRNGKRRPSPPVQQLTALSFSQTCRRTQEGALTIDTRLPSDFAQGHIEDSGNVPLHEPFGDIVRSLQNESAKGIILIAEEGAELTSAYFLARMGLNNLFGYMPDPTEAMQAHPKALATATMLSPSSFQNGRRSLEKLQLLDVRHSTERCGGSIPDSIVVNADTFCAAAHRLDPMVPTVVYCCGGERSSLAASLLRRGGFRAVFEIDGGFVAWDQFSRMEAKAEA